MKRRDFRTLFGLSVGCFISLQRLLADLIQKVNIDNCRHLCGLKSSRFDPRQSARRFTIISFTFLFYGSEKIRSLLLHLGFTSKADAKTRLKTAQGDLDRVSQTLTGRIRQLAERYATPLPLLTDEVAALAAKVDAHLKKMGAVL